MQLTNFIKRIPLSVTQESVVSLQLARDLCAMRLFTFTTAILCSAGLSSVYAKAKRDASQPYFDVYQGPDEQDSIVNDPSTSLEYTLSGGQP